jgi:hypothetical protein
MLRPSDNGHDVLSEKYRASFVLHAELFLNVRYTLTCNLKKEVNYLALLQVSQTINIS